MKTYYVVAATPEEAIFEIDVESNTFQDADEARAAVMDDQKVFEIKVREIPE